MIAVDLLGHGGSEKPDSGYSIPDQANLVAQALSRLGVRARPSSATRSAAASRSHSPNSYRSWSNRLVIMDSRPHPKKKSGLGTLAKLPFVPVIGPALWRIKPDFSIRKGLEVAFAPGFDVPDRFVEDVRRMTYTSYKESREALDDYTSEESLADRIAATSKPLLVLMGAEEQIIADPQATIAAYQQAVPNAFGTLIAGGRPLAERRGTEPDLGADPRFRRARRKPVTEPNSRPRCKNDVQDQEASGGALDYELMFETKTTPSRPAGRCGRPHHRLRNARRVRTRAGRPGPPLLREPDPEDGPQHRLLECGDQSLRRALLNRSTDDEGPPKRRPRS